MQTNQGAVAVEQSGESINIKGHLDDLISFASSNPAQGEHKWIGLDIDTGLDTIVGATWDGSEMTQADEDEASDLGLAKGHVIFWAKADVLVSEPRTITIASGETEIKLTVAFVEA